jgi:hypothetical protein
LILNSIWVWNFVDENWPDGGLEKCDFGLEKVWKK